MLNILAGNAAQAAMYCRDHGISLHDARYIVSPEQLRGQLAPDYAVAGTFWDAPRAIEIWKTLVTCYIGSKRPVPIAPPHIEPFLHPTLPTSAPTITGPLTGNVVSSILQVANVVSQGFPMIPNPFPDEDVLQPIEDDGLPKLNVKKKLKFKKIRK